MKKIIVLVLFSSLSACTFVKMAPGADKIRVAAIGKDLSACVKKGEIEVNVKDRLGPYQRNKVYVNDELETLARNEAPGLGADTIQAFKPAEDGYQRFSAFLCGTAKVGEPKPAQSKDAQTFPVKE
jgi:hypothetical protein